MAKKSKGPDDVGYGKPPKASQFKKGQSGNPAGRPTGSRSLQSILESGLKRRVKTTRTRTGTTRTVQMKELLVEGLIVDAVKGNARARQLLIPLILNVDTAAASLSAATSTPLSAAERDRLLDFVKALADQQP